MHITKLVLLVFAVLATETCARSRKSDRSLYSRGERLPDASNECAYFNCKGRRCVRLFCPKDLVFDPDRKACVNKDVDDDYDDSSQYDEYVVRKTEGDACGCDGETTTPCTTTTCTTPTTPCTTPTPTEPVTKTKSATPCTTPTTPCTTPTPTEPVTKTKSATPCTTPTTPCTTPTPTEPVTKTKSATTCTTTPRPTTPCETTPCITTPCPTTPCKTTPCVTTPCPTTPCTTPPCTTPPCTTSAASRHHTHSYSHKHYDDDFETKVVGYYKSRKDCANLSDGKILLHRKLCSRYYVCRNGKAKLTPCPRGFLFDREEESCRPHYEVTNCK